MAASVLGSVAYRQDFTGQPKEFGDCEHLRRQCLEPVPLSPGRIWACTAMTVHESVPSVGPRQFVRVSMPSEAAWPVGCSVNPLVRPSGPICGPRPREFTEYGC